MPFFRKLFLTAFSIAFLSFPCAVASPGLVLNGPDHYSFMVGDVKVTALSDGSCPLDAHEVLRDATKEKIDALLERNFQKNPVEASINAFLFRVGDKIVLVDTGAGELFGPTVADQLLSSLAAVGVAPDQVTDILLTHAHIDHMGGLTHSGKLTFPNATVHVAKADVDFFVTNRSASEKSGYGPKFFEHAEKALKPCVDAGKVKEIAADAEVLPGVTAELHPGHTPGSVFFRLTSHGEELVFIGDTIHIAAVQAAVPDVTISFDVDPAKAAAVRKNAFASFANNKTMIAVPHFSFPGVGFLRRAGEGYEWVPITYGNRDPNAKGK